MTELRNQRGETPQEAVDSLTTRDRNILIDARSGRVYRGSTGFTARGITEHGSTLLTEFGKECLKRIYRI